MLFAWNVRDPEQVARLVDALRAERPDVVVAIDEEGGDVTRLEAPTGSSYPGNLALGAVDDVELTSARRRGDGRRPRARRRQPRPRAGRGREHEPGEPDHRRALVRRPILSSSRATWRRSSRAPGGGRRRVREALPRARRHARGLAPRAADGGRRSSAGGAACRSARRSRPACAAIMTRAHPRAGARRRAGDAEPGVLRRCCATSSASTAWRSRTRSRCRAVSATVGVEEGAVRALAAGADALCLGADLSRRRWPRSTARIVAAVRAGGWPRNGWREAAGAGRRLARARFPRQTARRCGPTAVGPSRPRGARSTPRASSRSRASRSSSSSSPSRRSPPGRAGRGLGDALGTGDVVRLADVPRGAPALPPRPDRQLVLVLRDAHRHEWQRQAAALLIGMRPGRDRRRDRHSGLAGPRARPARDARPGPREPRGRRRAPARQTGLNTEPASLERAAANPGPKPAGARPSARPA